VCWFSIKTIFLIYEILSKGSGKLLAKIVFCSESGRLFLDLQNWVNSSTVSDFYVDFVPEETLLWALLSTLLRDAARTLTFTNTQSNT